MRKCCWLCDYLSVHAKLIEEPEGIDATVEYICTKDDHTITDHPIRTSCPEFLINRNFL